MGRKNAVLVGVDGCGLNAPVAEIHRWRKLLEDQAYGFSVRSLPDDASATKTNVITELQALLSGVQDDDELVFIFCGHGIIVFDRNGEPEEGLVVFDDNGSGMDVVTTNDFADIVEAADKKNPA